jgi:hypothetical protein
MDSAEAHSCTPDALGKDEWLTNLPGSTGFVSEISSANPGWRLQDSALIEPIRRIP